jgi:hypothetical protein
MQYHVDSNAPRFKVDWYTGENLRSISER